MSVGVEDGEVVPNECKIYSGTNLESKLGWVVTVKNEARASITLGYDETLRYWDHTGTTKNRTIIVAPGKKAFIGCQWAAFDRDDWKLRIERLIRPINRCFTDRSDCEVGVKLPQTQPRTPDLGRSCPDACRQGDNKRCPDLGQSLPRDTVRELTVLANEAFNAPLPKQVNMNPLLSMVGAPDCGQRKWPTLRPMGRVGEPSEFNFIGTACDVAYDERPYNIPVPGTPYYYDTVWFNVPMHVQGEFLRRFENPRRPTDPPPLIGADFIFDPSNTVYAQAKFFDPERPIPPEMEHGEDRLLSVRITRDLNRGGAQVVMQGEAFFCGRLNVNIEPD